MGKLDSLENSHRSGDLRGILGVWYQIQDRDSESLIEIEFREDGKMYYSTLEGDKWQIIVLTYYIDGDSIVSNQPSDPREEQTLFSINKEQVLTLTYDKKSTRYRRGKKTSPMIS
jgi:hypothetical protein